MSLYEQLSPFRCLRLRVEVTATRRIELPAYLGSTLRGAFGMALRRSACALRRQECGTCLLRATCIYSYTFETPLMSGGGEQRRYATAPHPFVLNLETGTSGIQEPGSIFAFGMTLVGRACDFLPYFVYAFQRMGELGIGKGRGTFELLRVYNLGPADQPAKLTSAGDGLANLPMPSYRPAVLPLAPHQPVTSALASDQPAILPSTTERPRSPHLASDQAQIPPFLKGGRGDFMADGDDADPVPSQGCQPETIYEDGVLKMPGNFLGLSEAQTMSAQLSHQTVRLRFVTPLRLVIDGELCREPQFYILARNLLRRLSNLVSFHCGQEVELPAGPLLDVAETVRLTGRNTRWYDWERYSKRQDKRMKLGGLLGEVTYRGDLAEFLPLLVLGSWVNLGKGTSFGLGRYRLETV